MSAYLKRLDSKINELWSQYTILIVKKNKTSNEKIEQKKRKRQQESVMSKEIKIEMLLCCIYLWSETRIIDFISLKLYSINKRMDEFNKIRNEKLKEMESRNYVVTFSSI